jgi:hypothetical protein
MMVNLLSTNEGLKCDKRLRPSRVALSVFFLLYSFFEMLAMLSRLDLIGHLLPSGIGRCSFLFLSCSALQLVFRQKFIVNQCGFAFLKRISPVNSTFVNPLTILWQGCRSIVASATIVSFGGALALAVEEQGARASATSAARPS